MPNFNEFTLAQLESFVASPANSRPEVEEAQEWIDWYGDLDTYADGLKALKNTGIGSNPPGNPPPPPGF